MSVNKALIIGYVGNPPALRYTPQGTPVCRFSVATNERWNGPDGPQERTEWHTIVVWRTLAEHCARYLNKGRQICVEGAIRSHAYEDKTGIHRRMTEIIARRIQFLGRKGGNGNGAAAGEAGFEDSLSSGPSLDDSDIPF